MKAIPVTCAIIIRQEKILVAKRSESMSLPGFWEFPGGKIEEGESPEECLIREIKEELGIVIAIHGQLTSSKFDYSQNTEIELIPFICTWEAGEINLQEHESILWLQISDLQGLDWAPADIPIWKELSEKWQAFRSMTSNKEI
ncbi:(deoxy)nucleoside triphosphate pyrophosphohydrolase [Algoriphagus aestuarii]|nr:(deoxy)nucleoside triphosphate pyrophosphohydrolase [Algoriphagus aestuarii]